MANYDPSNLFRSLLGVGRVPTEGEAAMMTFVRGVVEDWANGLLSLRDVREKTSDRERAISFIFCKKDDPLYAVFRELFDELVKDEIRPDGKRLFVSTTHGLFNTAHLEEDGARFNPDGSIDFPISIPWIRKPNPEIDDPGERGEPVYRERGR